MALQAGAYAIVNPSFAEPEFLVQWNQPSGFPHLLSGGGLRTRLGSEDLLVYAKQINLRTKVAASQATGNELPGVDIFATQISTATYRAQIRADWNHHDVAAAGVWGFSLPDAYKLGHRQGHFQLARDANLKGMNPQNNEGFLNTPRLVTVNLPDDPYGNAEWSTYDNGSMAFFLALQIQAIKQATLNLGLGQEFTILGPMRVLGPYEYNVVSLTQYQREGAGVASTAGTLEGIVTRNKDKITWVYDDTLEGAGSDGNDIVIIAMPDLKKPEPPGGAGPDLNVFADLKPGMTVCNTQYCDVAAPVEIMSPLAGGATDFLTEWRFSSGWLLRPEAGRSISAPYN
jgi:hypothetical protein